MSIGIRTDLAGLLIGLLLAPVLACCTTKAPQPSPATSTAVSVFSPTREVPSADTAGRLVSQRVASPPVIDGQVDALWATAQPLRLTLTWGMGGAERALDADLRALHTEDTIYLLAQWPGGSLPGEEDTVFNKLTLHWRIPEPLAQGLDCSVVCHTAFANGHGRFVYVNAETIPQGSSETLPAAGAEEAGTWTLEWGRPLINHNPFDLQFADLDRAYPFLIKVFERVEGRPDPVSQPHLLVFQP